MRPIRKYLDRRSDSAAGRAIGAASAAFLLVVIIHPAWGEAPTLSGCAGTTTTFTNSTPVPIPSVGTPVITSQITVSGVDSYLWDLDVQTFITHTFCADLDITLTSPAGRVVTLTTDNGSSRDNLFNGTVWDDQANPGGQVPYATNNGLVTDHAYVDNVVATPLAPEEPLGAFRGENPNGIWTLTISDDSNNDGGSLNSWSLFVTTFPAVPTPGAGIVIIGSAGIAIPDNGVTNAVIAVAGSTGQVCDVSVTTVIAHTRNEDLDITLTSPAGTVVTLTTDNGGDRDNVFKDTWWGDSFNHAGQVPYTSNDGLATDTAYVNNVNVHFITPEEAFSAFVGEDPNGNWTLTISDDSAGDTGTLSSWILWIDVCRLADADSDGTGDLCDGCPADPLKIAPGLCGCGVSDSLDTDGDGVPDCIDNCPDVANPLQTDTDGNNVGDDCEQPPAGQTGCGVCGAGGPVVLVLTSLGLIAIRTTLRRRPRR